CRGIGFSCRMATRQKPQAGEQDERQMRRLVMAAGFAVLSGTAGQAEIDRLQPDFTFRRVGVPESGTTNRITAQIDPNAPRRVAAPSAPAAPSGPAPAGQGGAAPAAAVSGAGSDWF